MSTPSVSTSPRLLSLAESAKYISISKTTLRKLIRDRRIHPIRVYGRVLIPVEQLDAMIVGVPAPDKGGVFVPVKLFEALWGAARSSYFKALKSGSDDLVISRRLFEALMDCWTAYDETHVQCEGQY
ncbi:helix-turn-helix domain-containing protein [Microvirga sp. 0TCS3.31]